MAERPVVLFDLDGTLLDSIELIVASFHHTRAVHVGDRLDDAFWIEGIGRPLRDQLEFMADDEAHLDAIVRTYATHNHEHHDAMVKPFEGVPEMLLELRRAGFALGIVTSKKRVGVNRGLPMLGDEDLFEVVVAADDVVKGKPDPEPVHLALRQLEASQAWFVGDSHHDLESGRAAGVHTMAVSWTRFERAQLEACEPHCWADTPEDIPRLINAMGPFATRRQG